MKKRYVQLVVYILLIFKTSVVYSLANNVVTLEPVDVKNFSENIDKNPNISGTRIVGLRYGLYEGNVNSDNMYVTLPIHHDKKVCVNSVIRSGRFNSENIYTIKSFDPNAQYAKITTITLNGKKYIEQIKLSNFSLKAFQSDDCDCCESNALYYPLMYKANRSNDLYIDFNSSGLPTESKINVKTDLSTSSIKGECIYNNNEANLTYDTTCKYAIDGSMANRNATLVVKFNDGIGEKQYEFNLKL
jgi:hypothetical protein